MKPYLIIIKDSFREAMASRVLWIVLLLLTAVLIALLPFHWVSTQAAKLDSNDIKSVRNVATELQAASKELDRPVQRRIWKSLEKDTRRKLEQVNRGAPGPLRFEAAKLLAKDFNKLLEQEDFYQPNDWEGFDFSTRLDELLSSPDLSEDQVVQRNRLLLEAALPGMLTPCPREAVMFRYGAWDISLLSPMPKSRAVERIDWAIMTVLSVFVGFFGVFAAILVTASIIPNMLSSGSLYLLLSKPIARPLLFLSKFFGGCSFVLVNVSYLIMGILLILGLRFQIWKPQLLWAIPIFLFAFAIFYSVSAVTGLIWRSTILSVGFTVIFWGICFVVGFTHQILTMISILPDQISTLVPGEDTLFVQRKNDRLGRWNESAGTIDEIMKTKRNGPAFVANGPHYLSLVYDDQAEMLLAFRRNWSETEIYAALSANDWKRELPTKGPPTPLAAFLRNGAPVIVTEVGIYEISMAQAEEALPDIDIFGWKIPAPARADSHRKISPKFERLPSSTKVVFSPDDDVVYLLAGQELRAFAGEETQFQERARATLNLKDVTHISAGNGLVAVANREDDSNSIHVFTTNQLTPSITLKPDGDDEVRHLEVSPDGRWIALLAEDDSLKLFDLSSQGKLHAQQKGVTAVSLRSNRLMTSNRYDRVTTSSLPEMKVSESKHPTLPLLKRIYRYGLNPLYHVCPKPSDLENTMHYAFTGKDTVKSGEMGDTTIKLDPWQPLYSNSAFIVGMLLLGCVYVYRQDF